MPVGGKRGRGGGRGRGRRKWGGPAKNGGGEGEAAAPPDVQEEAPKDVQKEAPKDVQKEAPKDVQEEAPKDVKEKCIDSPFEPRRVYVGNLKKGITDKEFVDKMASLVSVQRTRVMRDRFTKRSKGFGFVTVNTPEDVKKLVNLTGKDLDFDGHPMKISQARKKIDTRLKHDRDFDLSPTNPKKPSIHVLVNDVLIRILQFLKLKDMVRCERVCRRWQAVIHGMFAKTSLDLTRESLGVDGTVSISLVTKLLQLHGPHLKELKVGSVDYTTEAERAQRAGMGLHIVQELPKKHHVLKIIGYHCPNIESLDLAMIRGINSHILKVLAKRCTNLKSFTAKKCKNFDSKEFKTLLQIYPRLEVLCIKECSVSHYWFDMLPETLKELKISECPNSVKDGLQIGRSCPNLEVLQLGNLEIPTPTLFSIGLFCPKLTDLKIFLRYRFESPLEAFPNFMNLRSLSLCVDEVDLGKLMDQLPFLEKLAITGEDVSDGTDFSEWKDLLKLRVGGRILTEKSRPTIAKCPKLEEFFVDNPISISQNELIRIIRGCPTIKFVQCAGMRLGLDFISSLNNIMASRTTKIKIVIQSFNLTMKELLEAQYDLKKIEFEPIDGLREIDYPFSDYCESEGEEESDDDYDDPFYRNLYII